MSVSKHNLKTLKIAQRKFAADRDWDKFHSPKNLAMALIGETAEIVEHFQWLRLLMRGDNNLICMVPTEGVEPTHPHGYQILSLARLPIPPRRQPRHKLYFSRRRSK